MDTTGRNEPLESQPRPRLRFLRIKQAAQETGFSAKTLYREVAVGRLRVKRVGSGRSFVTTDAWLAEWVEASASKGRS
jgi:predicted DNA-binding transcriptional regulator AlpA